MAKLVCIVLLAILTTADLSLGQYNKKTYYVEPRCGSSSQTGSLNNPFASVQKALSAPGDDYTILLYPALYCETLKINKRVRLVKSIYGNSWEPATIGSKPYSTPIIEAYPKRLDFDSSIEQLPLTICNYKCGNPSTIKISIEEPQTPFVIVGDCSGKTLLPGSECTVTIKCGFSESAVQGYLKIENSHATEPERVLLVSNRIKPPPPPPPPYESTWICYNSPIPSGWIKVNDSWDPSRCGNPSFPGVYNVWIIARYDNQAVGTIMNVCAGQPIPLGWILIDTYKDLFSCGHPDGFSTLKNVQKIRRVQ